MYAQTDAHIVGRLGQMHKSQYDGYHTTCHGPDGCLDEVKMINNDGLLKGKTQVTHLPQLEIEFNHSKTAVADFKYLPGAFDPVSQCMSINTQFICSPLTVESSGVLAPDPTACPAIS